MARVPLPMRLLISELTSLMPILLRVRWLNQVHLRYMPLLVENSLYKKANRVLVVDVSPETQLKRTMQRDDVTREHVEQILAAQATREARLAVADDVIDNNGAPDAIASDVARLHAHYLQLASQFVSQEKP